MSSVQTFLGRCLYEMRIILSFLVPSIVLALAIGTIWGDPLSTTTFGIFGIAAAVYGYFRFIICSFIGRNLQRGQRQKRKLTQGQGNIVENEGFLLYQCALAMTIKGLDATEGGERTAEWFRDGIERNLTHLVSDGAVASAREMVFRLKTISQ